MPATPQARTSGDARTSLAKLHDLSAEQLNRSVIEHRAFEAVVWGMPAVNFQLLCDATIAVGGAMNQVVYWSKLPDWKIQTLTPNPDVIYLYPFFDTKHVGPMVLEIPPADGGSITGSVDDAWQTALEDVGPAGVDKGKGGKYLILPPGYKDKVPGGYIALPCETYRSYAILRSNLASGSDADVAKAVAYGKRVKVYPLSQAADPPGTKFVDALNSVYENIIPYDLRFFSLLDRFVQHEPWITRDKAMIDMLKSIGIEKGKAFSPDEEMQDILNTAAAEARAWLDLRYEDIFAKQRFVPSARWTLPVNPEMAEGMQTDFANPDSYPVDGRGVAYSMAYFSAKHLGAGQYYLMTVRDKDGDAFDGAKTYRLKVPANPPVKLYWSATIYDRETHAPIREVSRASRASTSPGIQKNADGSTDVYFGPQAPDGQDANWVPTNADGKFEVLFRFYGPEKPLFDKSWVLPDIEKMK